MSFSPHPLLGRTLSEFWTHSCRLSPAEALLAAASDLCSCKHGLAQDGLACPWASVMAVPRRACVHVLRVRRVASGLHISTWSCTWGQRTSCCLPRPQGLSGWFQGPGYFQKEDQAGTKESQANLKITDGGSMPRATWQTEPGPHRRNRSQLLWAQQPPLSKVPGSPPCWRPWTPWSPPPTPCSPVISRALGPADSWDRAHPP